MTSHLSTRWALRRRWSHVSAVGIVLLAMAPTMALAALPAGKGLVLPVQDRVGAPELSGMIRGVVTRALGDADAELVEASGLRDRLRRLRIRSVSQVAPEKLAELTAELGVDWILSTTLHEIVEAEISYLTLSGTVIVVGRPELAWAGFLSATSIDQSSWFGVGVVEGLETLAAISTERLLIGLLTEPPRRRERRGLQRSAHTFLRQPVTTGKAVLVAVVPFDSVTDRSPGKAAEIITASALAVLHEAGFSVLHPGVVDWLFREQGRLLVGQVDPLGWRGLANELSVALVLTGTVETYLEGSGLKPDPWVAFSARLVSTEDGTIVWTGGLERRGSDSDGAFELGRIYSTATLAHEIMRSLITTSTKDD